MFLFGMGLRVKMKFNLHDVSNMLVKFKSLIKILANKDWQDQKERGELIKLGDEVLLEIDQFWKAFKKDLPS